MQEYIYILINPSIPKLVKIGRTDRTPEDRAQELSTTGVPTPFIVAYEHIVGDSRSAEMTIHKILNGRGLQPMANREFFEIPLKEAVAIVSDVCRQFDCKPALHDENTLDCEGTAPSLDFLERGISSYYGFGTDFQDYKAALENLEISYKLGANEAAPYLSQIYLWGLAGAKNPARALNILKEVAQKGLKENYLDIAKIFLGWQINPQTTETSNELINYENAIKSYILYFSQKLTDEERVDAVNSILSAYKIMQGKPFPLSIKLGIIEDQIEAIANLARDNILNTKNGLIVKILLMIDENISESYKASLLEKIFLHINEETFSKSLRNLPQSRIDDYLLKFRNYIY